MNIAVLGCSWSADLSIPHRQSGTGLVIDNSWPQYFATNNPEHTIYNFAMQGSSLLYSIWWLEKIKSGELYDKHGIAIDKIIFQITSEGRVTFLAENLKPANDFFKKITMVNASDVNWLAINNGKEQEEKINYYKVLDHDDMSKAIRMNYSTLWQDDALKVAKDLAVPYYQNLERDMHFDLEYKIFVEYINRNVDYCFFHKNPTDLYYSIDYDIDCIESVLGTEQFKNYVFDIGSHFDVDGMQWEAKYIEDRLKAKNII